MRLDRTHHYILKPKCKPQTQIDAHADRLYGRASTDDVVQSVRRLRAERDQLRLRDRDHARRMHQVPAVVCHALLVTIFSQFPSSVAKLYGSDSWVPNMCCMIRGLKGLFMNRELLRSS